MKRVTGLLTLVALVSTLVTPSWSQGMAPDSSRSAPPAASASCFEQGREAGSSYPTGGAFTVGLVSGALAGLIGTGLAYAFQAEPAAPEELVRPIADSGCRVEFRSAYAKEARAKKRRSALLGGLLGSAVAAVVIVSTAGN